MKDLPHGSAQPDDEALESLLDGAEWPEPSPESLLRLEAYWQRATALEVVARAKPRGSRQRRLWWFALAASAALLAVMILVWKSVRIPELVKPNVPKSGGDVPDSMNSEERNAYVFRSSRPARDDEKLAFILLPATDSTPRPEPAPEPDEPLSEVITRLAGQDPIPWETLPPPAATRFLRQQHVHQLWQLIHRQGPKAERQVAIQLLRKMGGPQAIRPLLTLVADRRTHDLAVREVAPLLPALQLGRLIQAEADEKLKRLLLMRLLSNGSKKDTDVFLNFVWQQNTRHMALSVIHDHPQPPIEMLFQSIDSPRHRERLVAARALGNVCNPDVSQRLITMAMQGRRRSEALLALIGCHDDKALSFLRQAQKHQLYAASLRLAVFQLKSLP